MFLLLHFFFFFNDTATTEIYTLSLHDALPISVLGNHDYWANPKAVIEAMTPRGVQFIINRSVTIRRDRKSTRLNSSHSQISYAVFCLKKKKKINQRCAYIIFLFFLIYSIQLSR